MSATAATARYVIAADDKTKAAIASTISGFRNMERGIRGTVSRINVALGLIAGIGVKRAFQSVFTETAKQSKEFASALDDVKRSARGLLAAKDGAPAATAAMRELAVVLKDPEVVAAADAIASVFIRGAAGAVKFALGAKTLREEIDELKRAREDLVSGKMQASDVTFLDEPTFNTDREQQIFRLSAAIEQKELQDRERQRIADRQRAEEQNLIDYAGSRAAQRFNTMREFQENIKFLEDLDKETTDTEYFDQIKREADVAGLQIQSAFFDRMDEAASNVDDTMDRTADSIAEVGDVIGDNINKTSEWSVAADQAARNIQDAFANFLFDPFEDGLKGMLRGFIDVVRRMVAEMAAAKIFGSKSSGGLGFGDFLGGLFGAFGGGGEAPLGPYAERATGGPVTAGKLYRVNENEMEFLRPNQSGEVIPLSKMGAAGGGGYVINMPVHIDARGATQDAVKLIPGAINTAVQRAKAEFLDMQRRGQARR